MKFLVDNALSPIFCKELSKAGYNSVHVRDVDLHKAKDSVIFDYAAKEGRIVLSADTDFGTILASRGSSKPSVVLFRSLHPRKPTEQAKLLIRILPEIKEDLLKGSIVVIEDTRMRIRQLPIL